MTFVGSKGLSVTDNDGFYGHLVIILVKLKEKSGTLLLYHRRSTTEH